MEINSGAFTWNLGDTSFRRKALLNDYKILLNELNQFNKDFNNAWNPEVESEYYRRLIRNSDLLKDSQCKAEKQDKLARTYTSALYKLGLCTEKRVVSQVGLQYLNEIPFEFDEFEKRLGLKQDNIIFIRQLLKLCIHERSQKVAFNPFIFLIKLLNKYDYLSKNEFVFLIQSATGRTNFKNVLDGFSDVRNKKISLERFIEDNFISDTNSDEKEEFINKESFDEELFKKVFVNRKTSESVEKYKQFYLAIIDYKQHNDTDSLNKLVSLLKLDAIKKAFATTELINSRKLSKISINEFNTMTKDIKFLSLEGKEFREAIIERFIYGKQKDLLKEYIDMTFRVFNLTGLINLKNDKIQINNVYAKEYFKYIDNLLDPVVENNQSKILDILTTNEILGVDKVSEVDKIIYDKYNIDSNESINDYLKKEEIKAFTSFILKNFPKNNVVELLKQIRDRNDTDVFNKVTDQTTIPTIFEYILGIAWFYISDFKFNLYDSLNLTLDSSYYPLSHAAGGYGDIVIDYNNPIKHILMLEATLMDTNTQKRGELEPVIRHATNLTIENSKDPVYTLFIANELDNNVINIFRFCDLIKLESSKNKGEFTDSTKIAAFTIDEVISLLEKDIKYDQIFKSMEDEFKIKDINTINSDWKSRFSANVFG